MVPGSRPDGVPRLHADSTASSARTRKDRTLPRPIDKFPQNDGMSRAGGGRQIGGTAVKCFVGENGKGHRLFGVFGNPERFRTKNGHTLQLGGNAIHEQAIVKSAAGNDQLGGAEAWKNPAFDRTDDTDGGQFGGGAGNVLG